MLAIWLTEWGQIICIQADGRLIWGHCKQATSHRSSTSSSLGLHPRRVTWRFGENISGCFTSSGTSLAPRSPSSMPPTMACSSSRREAIWWSKLTALGLLTLSWNGSSNNSEVAAIYREVSTQLLVFLTGFRWICISWESSVAWGGFFSPYSVRSQKGYDLGYSCCDVL